MIEHAGWLKLPRVFDRYGPDAIAAARQRAHTPTPTVPAQPGLVVEDVATGYVGAVVRTEKIGGRHVVVLENRFGRTRSFTLGPGFWVDGKPVILAPAVRAPRPAAPPQGVSPSGRALTASGSYKVELGRAKVARASRLWVEGKHDAELIERVWGDDLRVEAVVVELLDGVGNLEAALADFQPGDNRRAGILLDHLVPGSKESRIAQEVARRFPTGVLILGHPFVDVWQAVRPQLFGLQRWPDIPRHLDIKVGTLQALGWPHRTKEDVADGWRRILAKVNSYRDLDPALLGRVEELIDFVTAGTDA